MKKKGVGVWGLLFITLCLTSSTAEAGEDAFSKLGRGTSNVIFGWGELPRQTELACKEKAQSLCVFEGIARGTYWTLLRMGAGLYEIVTFPFGGERHYGPILEPENVFSEIGDPSRAIT